MRVLLLSCLLITAQCVCGQHVYKSCTTQRFRNGKPSTAQCWDADKRWGRAYAFNTKGDTIYNCELRSVGGHASVAFRYDASGAVQEAHWHSAPDGGIQWYNTDTYFDATGTITGRDEHNYDDRPTVTYPRIGPVRQLPPKPAADTPSTQPCSEIYSSEIWFVNTTPATALITVARKTQPTETYTVTLKKGESSKCGQFILAQQFDDPAKFYTMSVKQVGRGKALRLIILPADEQPMEDVSHGVRRYYYHVRRVL